MNERNEPPLQWGRTRVTDYFESARSNGIATYVNNRTWFEKLERIDALFRTAIDNLHNSPKILPAWLLMRTHAGYLAAFQLSVCGQVTESYIIMRNCIESCLYAFHADTKSEAALVWINRNDSESAKKDSKREFQFSTVLSTLETVDSKQAAIVEVLYDRLIDFGGHPNAYSILTNLKLAIDPNKVDFKLLYTNAGSESQNLALKTLGQVGLTCLYIFKRIWKERFDITGLSDRIERERSKAPPL